jgi:hypothetical protein
LIELIFPLISMLEGMPLDHKSLSKLLVPPELLTPELTALRDRVVEAVNDQLVVSAPDPNKCTVIFTDAQDYYWASIVCQCSFDQLALPVEQRTYSIIDVHHGAFRAKEVKRHIWEKELFALQATVKHSSDLIRGARGPVLAYSDSSTVVARCRPFAHTPAAEARVRRWLMLIRGYRLVVMHIKGVFNVIADALSRTAPKDLQHVAYPFEAHKKPGGGAGQPVIRIITRSQADAAAQAESPFQVGPNQHVVPVAFSGDTISPSPIARLLDYQNEYQHGLEHDVTHVRSDWIRKMFRNARPAAFVSEDFMARLRLVSDPDAPERARDEWDDADQVWIRATGHRVVRVIPKSSPALVEEILALNHVQGAYHPAASVTNAIIRQLWDFDDLDDLVTAHVERCMGCIMADNFKRPSALGTSRIALGPFGLCVCDYGDFGVTGYNGHRYVLFICDVYSLRLYMASCASESAEFAAQQCVKLGALVMDYHGIFSDQGAAFIAKFTEEVMRLKSSNQFFAIANVEYTRGLSEQAVKKGTNVLRKLLVASRVKPEFFPDYLDPASAIINNTPSVTLRGASPNEISFGESRLPGVSAFATETGTPRTILSNPATHAIAEEHFRVWSSFKRAMELGRFPNTPKPSARSLQGVFAVKDYVFIAEASPLHKLVPRWSRVASVLNATGERTYRVTELATGTTSEQHVSNLRRCNGSVFEDKLSAWEYIFYALFAVNGISYINDLVFKDDTVWCTVHYSDARFPDTSFPVHSWLPELRMYFAALMETDEVPEGPVHAALAALLEG